MAVTEFSKFPDISLYHTKNKVKRIKDLNLRPESINLLEENISRTLFGINHSKFLYDPPPRAMEIKINKVDLIKFKLFCSVNETINKMKRQPAE